MRARTRDRSAFYAATTLALLLGSAVPALTQNVVAKKDFDRFARGAAGCPKAVIYVSDAQNNVVDIYPLAGAHQTMCGQLPVSGARGLAVDFRRNLYVATANGTILKFPPGATSPTLTISEPNQYPLGVSVNAKGLIAVTNYSTFSDGSGSLSIYKPDGSPVGTFQDSNPDFINEYFCKIAENGDVYTSVIDRSKNLGYVSVFKAPAYRATDLPITFGFPGGIDLVENDLFVGDAIANTITEYRDAVGRGRSFKLDQAQHPSTFEITSVRGGMPLYMADGSGQLQEYLFGKSDAVNLIAIPNGSPVGIAIVRGF